MDNRYQKFTTSKQEPLRLSIALEGFFKMRRTMRQEVHMVIICTGGSSLPRLL